MPRRRLWTDHASSIASARKNIKGKSILFLKKRIIRPRSVTNSMLTIFFRAIVLYIVLMITMRAMGKRQLGQFQPYEFVMAMLIANLVATPMSDVSTPLLHGVLPVAALFIVHALITVLCLHSDRIRALISGKPSLIISRGIIRQQELDRLCMTLSDLLEGLRAAGILDPAEVGTAVMEANGTISAFPRASRRPPTTSEMNIDPGYEGLPMVLIMDGRIQPHNLSSACLTEEWLINTLSARNLTEKQVFLASLDTQGRMTVQDRAGTLIRFEALSADEVKW